MIRHQWTAANGQVFDLSYPVGPVLLSNAGVRGMGMPEFDEFVREAPLLDGQTFAGWRAKPREVFWPVVISTFNHFEWSATQRDFWQSMHPGRYGTWRVTDTETGVWRELVCRFRDDGDATYEVDPTRDYVEVHGVRLVADDPWWRGPEESKTFQTAEDALPFFAGDPLADAVFNIASASTTDAAFMNNDGDIPAWPTIRVDGPATAFRVNSVAGEIDVAEGERLEVYTDPTRQTARLYTDEFSYTDVTDQLTDVQFAPIGSGPLNIELLGTGSLTISFRPGYKRAF